MRNYFHFNVNNFKHESKKKKKSNFIQYNQVIRFLFFSAGNILISPPSLSDCLLTFLFPFHQSIDTESFLNTWLCIKHSTFSRLSSYWFSLSFDFLCIFKIPTFPLSPTDWFFFQSGMIFMHFWKCQQFCLIQWLIFIKFWLLMHLQNTDNLCFTQLMTFLQVMIVFFLLV